MNFTDSVCFSLIYIVKKAAAEDKTAPAHISFFFQTEEQLIALII